LKEKAALLPGGLFVSPEENVTNLRTGSFDPTEQFAGWCVSIIE
jgi:hypothetical protein